VAQDAVPPATDNISGCVVTNDMDLLLMEEVRSEKGLGPRAVARCTTAVRLAKRRRGLGITIQLAESLPFPDRNQMGVDLG
jgi:hypothetical protein